MQKPAGEIELGTPMGASYVVRKSHTNSRVVLGLANKSVIMRRPTALVEVSA